MTAEMITYDNDLKKFITTATDMVTSSTGFHISKNTITYNIAGTGFEYPGISQDQAIRLLRNSIIDAQDKIIKAANVMKSNVSKARLRVS